MHSGASVLLMVALVSPAYGCVTLCAGLPVGACARIGSVPAMRGVHPDTESIATRSATIYVDGIRRCAAVVTDNGAAITAAHCLSDRLCAPETVAFVRDADEPGDPSAAIELIQIGERPDDGIDLRLIYIVTQSTEPLRAPFGDFITRPPAGSSIVVTAPAHQSSTAADERPECDLATTLPQDRPADCQAILVDSVVAAVGRGWVEPTHMISFRFALREGHSVWIRPGDSGSPVALRGWGRDASAVGIGVLVAGIGPVSGAATPESEGYAIGVAVPLDQTALGAWVSQGVSATCEPGSEAL